VPTRCAALAVLLAAVIAAGPAYASVAARITVKPAPVKVGAKTALAVKLTTGASQKPPSALYLKLISPRGWSLRVRLSRSSTGTWRTTFVFLNKGRWGLRAVAGAGGSPPVGSVLGTSSLVVR
jgi:hypothetical protein